MKNIEVVDKKGVVIQTADKKVAYTEFLNIIKKFKCIMVGVGGGEKPFNYVYFKVSKKDIIRIVRMNMMEVTYSIMYNSKVQKHLDDILYVSKMRMTLLDEK